MQFAKYDNDIITVTCRVGNARPAYGKELFALVDVEVEISGILIGICGVQARRLESGGTSIHLPTYKGVSGCSHAAVRLPEEVRGALTDAILEFLIEEGLAKVSYSPPTLGKFL